MSVKEKILIPLIDDSIKLNDVLSDNFIGVFTEDINAPCEKCVYLVYVYDMNNLHMSINSHSDVVRNIGGQLYHILKFTINSADLRNALSGYYQNISNEGVSKIYNFWKDEDEHVAKYPFARVLVAEAYNRTIPEEIYVPLCKKESRGITVQHSNPRDLIFKHI